MRGILIYATIHSSPLPASFSGRLYHNQPLSGSRMNLLILTLAILLMADRMMAACSTDEDCGGKLVCDKDHGNCVACNFNRDCDGTLECNDYMCTTYNFSTGQSKKSKKAAKKAKKSAKKGKQEELINKLFPRSIKP